jgi:hypothetical protein
MNSELQNMQTLNYASKSQGSLNRRLFWSICGTIFSPFIIVAGVICFDNWVLIPGGYYNAPDWAPWFGWPVTLLPGLISIYFIPTNTLSRVLIVLIYLAACWLIIPTFGFMFVGYFFDKWL